MGLMHKLLEQALKNMRQRGQHICYLYPVFDSLLPAQGLGDYLGQDFL